MLEDLSWQIKKKEQPTKGRIRHTRILRPQQIGTQPASLDQSSNRLV